MAGRQKGMLERDMLANLREWPDARRQSFMLRADELCRTMRYVERRERDKPADPFQLQAQADSLALITISTEPTAEAGEEAQADLASAF